MQLVTSSQLLLDRSNKFVILNLPLSYNVKFVTFYIYKNLTLVITWGGAVEPEFRILGGQNKYQSGT